MPVHHLAGHEIELLEAYIHDFVVKLPKLHTNEPIHEIPSICSTYHTSCSTMMKEVLSLLELISPRLCRLLSQIWDLTSLNFYVMMKLAHTTIDEKEEVLRNWKKFEAYHLELAGKHMSRAQRHEVEVEKLRLECRELRGDMHKTQVKASRVVTENVQLHRALRALVEVNQRSTNDECGSLYAGKSNVVEAEEWELLGIHHEELEALEKVNSMDTCAEDFDRLFQMLLEREREQLGVLNEMDRFMNSNVVALLWRHQSGDDSKFLQKMMNSRTICTQTEGIDWNDRVSEKSSTDEDELDSKRNCGSSFPPSLRAQLSTRPIVQRVLEKGELSRLIIQVLLEKLDADTNGFTKSSQPDPSQQSLIRPPRLHLHRFLKDFFLQRFGIVALSDYHLMEFVKSCLFYHDTYENEYFTARSASKEHKLLTHGSQKLFLHGNDSSELSNVHTDFLLAAEDASDADARIVLFTKLCELAPVPDVLAGGNFHTSAFNAFIDAMGDLFEVDLSITSLKQVLQDTESSSFVWETSWENASLVLSQHLRFLGPVKVETVLARMKRYLSTTSDSNPSSRATTSNTSANSTINLNRRLSALTSRSLLISSKVSVDLFFTIFMSAWLEYDQIIYARLRDAFRHSFREEENTSLGFSQDSNTKTRDKSTSRQTTVSSLSSHTIASNGGQQALDHLKRILRNMEDDFIRELDMDEITKVLQNVLESKRVSTLQKRNSLASLHLSRRPTTPVNTTGGIGLEPNTGVGAGSLSVGGINEQEFAFHILQHIRGKRQIHGIRTNGIPIFQSKTKRFLGAGGHIILQAVPDDKEEEVAASSTEMTLPTLPPIDISMLKPGLRVGT